MSLTKTELAQAQALILQAEAAKSALTKFFTTAQALLKDTKNPALCHQITKQALASAGMSKLVENIDAILKTTLDQLPRGNGVIVTPAMGIDDFLVPSYDYTPTTSCKPKLVDKDDNGAWLMVLRVLVQEKAANAVEKRLVATPFNDPVKGKGLLEACGGLVEFKDENTWSVTKHK